MAKIVANPALELAFACDLFAPDAVQQSALIPDAAKRATLDDFESTNPQPAARRRGGAPLGLEGACERPTATAHR